MTDVLDNDYFTFSGTDAIIHFARDNTDEHYPGSIDYIRLYDGVLTSGEVSALAAGGAPPGGPPPVPIPPLVLPLLAIVMLGAGVTRLRQRPSA